MAWVAAVVAVIGAGIQVYGAMEEGDAKAEQADRDAKLRRQQKMELESRVQSNVELMEDERDDLLSTAQANYGKGGLAIMEKIYRNSYQRIEKMKREGSFQAGMIEEGALTQSILAGEYREAGSRSAVGYGVGGLGQASNAYTRGSSSSGSNVDNSGTRKVSGTK